MAARQEMVAAFPFLVALPWMGPVETWTSQVVTAQQALAEA
jgi:hypothetical protein